ncbi:MAG: amidohydrolase family protein [Bacteroidia bacterium]
MRYITADYIFPITSAPIKNGIIQIDDDGKIISISEQPHPDNYRDSNLKLQTLKGIIVPGFINAHCHLELSHLKDQIKPGTGLAGFIKEILAIRNNYALELIQQTIIDAEKEMFDNGIVAVADISNDDYTFAKKATSKIYFHTLIEAFDIVKERAEQMFQHCVDLGEQLKNIAPQNANHSIVPHAPYTVTPTLFELIKNLAAKNNSIQSIHNQECEAESELFKNKSGAMYDLFANAGLAMQQFEATGKNSLQSVLTLMNSESKTLLVHNTFTDKQDIEWAHQHHRKLYWCFCPNANLYIENRLPQFENFISTKAKCCIGTDSYTSNWSLSVLDELKTISKHNPSIPLQTKLTWATINGAEYLDIEKTFGSIEAGKKPGLNLIENIDLENLQLTASSSVKKII